MSLCLAFLDRDGTINVDHGYVHRWDQWQFVPGAIAGLRLLHESAYLLVIVSNQSGIARGLYTNDEVLALHRQMSDELNREGIPIAAIAYCPHGASDHCVCRKPGTGLAKQIATQLAGEIDYQRSWTIGDKLSDLQFGKSLGTKTALLNSRYWKSDEITSQPDIIAADLRTAALQICNIR